MNIGKDLVLGALLMVGLAGLMFFALAAPVWMTFPMKAIASLVFILIIFAAVKMAL